jgi:integrating conjugative element protein (TIGR03755 family)
VALQQLVRNFKRAADAAQYATDVMGEVEVATCDGAACPAKSTSTGMGLAPKFEGEVPPLRQAMNNLLAAPVPDATNLDLVSAPGVTVSREVVEALKELPPTERAIATERLVREIAVAKTIDKALAIRNTMLTGMTEPNIYASVGVKEAQAKLAILNRLIEDFLFEGRVRKEMVSATALALVEGARGVKANSVTVQPGRAGDTRTVNDGGIKP